jgi:hypothetical protein
MFSDLSSFAARASGTRRRIASSAIGVLLLVGAAATNVSAAPPPLTVQVSVGDYCVYGTAKSNATVKVVIRDSDNNVKGRDVQVVSDYGEWSGCVDYYGDVLQAGDKVKATVFETGQERSFTIPRLVIQTNRVTDVVSGKGPAGSALTLFASDYGWSYYGMDDYDASQDVVVSGAGTYSYDFGNQGIDLLGGASVAAVWSAQGGNVSVIRSMTVPYVSLYLGRSQFYGAARPSQYVALSLTIGSTEVAEGHAVASYGPGLSYQSTDFEGRFVDSDGEPYRVHGGEQLSAPALGSDADWQVPAINGTVDLATDKVSGTCFPNSLYIVLVSSSDAYGSDYGTANGSGNFTKDMTAAAGNVRSGAIIDILCVSPSRDQVQQEFTAG